MLTENLLYLLSFIALGLFVWMFTGELHIANARKKLRLMSGFSYLFALGLLTMVLFSFKFPQWFAPQTSDHEAFSIGPACVIAPKHESVPAGLDCAAEAQQWVINIGGRNVAPPPAKDAARAATIASQNDGNPVQDAPGDTSEKPESTDSDPTPTSATSADIVDKPRELAHLKGGLVVPLFVIMVALMGAAVSMTRRVPEIQKQAWRYIDLHFETGPDGDTRSRTPTPADFKDSVFGDADGSHLETRRPITLEYARECLIFQVMQVVSAPVVAMVAYYLFEPDTKAVTILIAFVSGFASESVLIAIRNISESVIGGRVNRAKTDNSTTPPAPPALPAPPAG